VFLRCSTVHEDKTIEIKLFWNSLPLGNSFASWIQVPEEHRQEKRLSKIIGTKSTKNVRYLGTPCHLGTLAVPPWELFVSRRQVHEENRDQKIDKKNWLRGSTFDEDWIMMTRNMESMEGS